MTINPDVVREALEPIYGSGSMVTTLAGDIVDRWDGWITDEHRDLETYLTLHIWNWFSGGTTAEYAAKQVLEATSNRNETGIESR